MHYNHEKYMRFLEVAWGLIFGGAGLLCFVGAILTLIFLGGQHTDRLLLFGIYAVLLARGGEQ